MHQGAVGPAYTRRAVKQIDALPEYVQVFRRIFGRPVNGTGLIRAIAACERTPLPLSDLVMVVHKLIM